jgi:pseudomonalisin
MGTTSSFARLSAATAAVIALGVGGAPAPAGAAVAWSSTATHAETLVNATHLGAASPTMPLRIAASLRMRNRSGLEKLIAGGQVITPAQFVAGYAPSAAQAGAVVTYLTKQGFTGVTLASNRLLITASGTAAQASKAFDTPIERYLQNGKQVYANTKAAQVPVALASTVGAVVGLTNAGRMNVHATQVAAVNPPAECVITGVGYPCDYNPAGFWKAYDATTAPTGSGTRIAIFAEGAVNSVVTDLRAEEKANGLAQVPVTIVHTGPATADTLGLDEWDMDTQY